MSFPPEVLWIACFVLLPLLSWLLWAVITVRSHLRALTKRLDDASIRSSAHLAADVAELNVALTSLSTTVKRLSSRNGMQDMRERRRAESTASEELSQDPQIRKSQLRLMLANGTKRVIRDGSPHDST